MLHLIILFFAKICDKSLYTAQVIFVQRNKAILAAIAIALSDFIYLYVVSNVVSDNSFVSMIVVAAAGGVGCYLAVQVSDKIGRDRLFVNIILSDDITAIQEFSLYLNEHEIPNLVMDTYNRKMDRKTLSLTIYAETKAQSSIISEYIRNSDKKFKRIVQT